MAKRLLLASALLLLLAVPAAADQPGSLASLSKMELEKVFPKDPAVQALAQAAARGDVREIDRLVAAGANVNTVGAYGLTVCAWVAEHPNRAGLRRLLEHGADPNKLWSVDSSSGRSLVHWAAGFSGLYGLDYLKMVLGLGKGDPNLASSGVTLRPIECAIGESRRAAFLLLYKAGAKIDYRTPNGKDGYSIVQKAADSPNRDFLTVMFCLEKGVDYNITGPDTSPDGQRRTVNLKENIEIELNSRWVAGKPEHPQYMWFWRCVDFLEKRGMRFSYPDQASRPLERPKELDTTPVDIAMANPALLSAAHFDVNLVFTAPVWAEMGWTDRGSRVSLKRTGNLIEYAYRPHGPAATNPDATMDVALLYAPGTSLQAAVDFAVKRFASGYGQACTVTAIESTADHRTMRVAGPAGSGIDGCLYAGKYKDTVVVVRQMWKSNDPEISAQYRDKALRSMQMVRLRKGYAVLAPVPEPCPPCGPGCGPDCGAAQAVAQ